MDQSTNEYSNPDSGGSIENNEGPGTTPIPTPTYTPTPIPTPTSTPAFTPTPTPTEQEYASTPRILKEAKNVLTTNGESYDAALFYDDKAGIPEDAVFTLTEITDKEATDRELANKGGSDVIIPLMPVAPVIPEVPVMPGSGNFNWKISNKGIINDGIFKDKTYQDYDDVITETITKSNPLPVNSNSLGNNAPGDLDLDSGKIVNFYRGIFLLTITDKHGNIIEPKNEVEISIRLNDVAGGWDLTDTAKTLRLVHIYNEENDKGEKVIKGEEVEADRQARAIIDTTDNAENADSTGNTENTVNVENTTDTDNGKTADTGNVGNTADTTNTANIGNAGSIGITGNSGEKPICDIRFTTKQMDIYAIDGTLEEKQKWSTAFLDYTVLDLNRIPGNSNSLGNIDSPENSNNSGSTGDSGSTDILGGPGRLGNTDNLGNSGISDSSGNSYNSDNSGISDSSGGFDINPYAGTNSVKTEDGLSLIEAYSVTRKDGTDNDTDNRTDNGGISGSGAKANTNTNANNVTGIGSGAGIVPGAGIGPGTISGPGAAIASANGSTSTYHSHSASANSTMYQSSSANDPAYQSDSIGGSTYQSASAVNSDNVGMDTDTATTYTAPTTQLININIRANLPFAMDESLAAYRITDGRLDGVLKEDIKPIKDQNVTICLDKDADGFAIVHDNGFRQMEIDAPLIVTNPSDSPSTGIGTDMDSAAEDSGTGVALKGIMPKGATVIVTDASDSEAARLAVEASQAKANAANNTTNITSNNAANIIPNYAGNNIPNYAVNNNPDYVGNSIFNNFGLSSLTTSGASTNGANSNGSADIFGASTDKYNNYAMGNSASAETATTPLDTVNAFLQNSQTNVYTYNNAARSDNSMSGQLFPYYSYYSYKVTEEADTPLGRVNAVFAEKYSKVDNANNYSATENGNESGNRNGLGMTSTAEIEGSGTDNNASGITTTGMASTGAATLEQTSEGLHSAEMNLADSIPAFDLDQFENHSANQLYLQDIYSTGSLDRALTPVQFQSAQPQVAQSQSQFAQAQLSQHQFAQSQPAETQPIQQQYMLYQSVQSQYAQPAQPQYADNSASTQSLPSNGSGKFAPSVLAAYDISIQNGDTEYQPTAARPISVSITNPGINESKANELEIWHRKNDGTLEQITNFNITGNTITFYATSFSVYVVVEYEISKVIKASDGNNYNVTVRYDNTAGLPETVQLAVEEILDYDIRYADYISESAKQLACDGNDISYARVFDINLVNGEGVTCEPVAGSQLHVSITLKDMETAIPSQVIHFGDQTEVVNSNMNGTTLEFDTDSFSVYTIVTVSTKSIEEIPVTSIEANTAYYFKIKTSYMTNEPKIQDNLNSVVRNTDFQYATCFYFEAVDDTQNRYYIYTYNANNIKKYLYFKASGNNGHLLLDENTKGIFTVTVYNAAEGLYGISGTATDDSTKTYYLNLHKENKFAGWIDPPSTDAGSRVKIFTVDHTDPLQLDGKKYILVNANQYAISTTPKTANNGFQGLDVIEVVKDSNTNKYSPKTAGVDIPIWLFTALPNGNYYISTIVGGSIKYLNIAGVEPKAGGHVTLSDMPQELYLIQVEGQIAIADAAHKKCRLDRFEKQGNVFSSWAETDTPNANEKFTLAELEGNSTEYIYIRGDSYSSRDLVEKTVSKYWDENDTVLAPEVNSYTDSSDKVIYYYTATNGEYDYIYTFLYWQGSDGKIYNPGIAIYNPSTSEKINLTLTSVWKKEKTITYKYEPYPDEDASYHHNLNIPNKSIVYSEGMEIATPSSLYYESYNEDNTKGYFYTFDYWLGSDGKAYSYSAGAEVLTSTEYSFYFISIWEKVGDIRDVFTINNHISGETKKVLGGTEYIYEVDSERISSENITGAIVLNGDNEIEKRFYVNENGRLIISITDVNANYEIYPIYNVIQSSETISTHNNEYQFFVAVNGGLVKVKRPYYMELFKTGESNAGRQYLLNSYLHDVYGKFYNTNIQSQVYKDYMFGHSDGDKNKTWNRKSGYGVPAGYTSFFKNEQNKDHYVFYTPYIPSVLDSSSEEEISFYLNKDDNLKKESFYTISLADNLNSKYTSEELSYTPLSGRDITTTGSEFTLNSITNNDFVSATGYSTLNVIGFNGRKVEIELKVPDVLIANKTTGGLITELYLKGLGSDGGEISGTYDAASRKYTFLIPSDLSNGLSLNQPYEIRMRDENLYSISVYDGNAGIVTIATSSYIDKPMMGMVTDAPMLVDNKVTAPEKSGLEIKFCYTNTDGTPLIPVNNVVCSKVDPEGKITSLDGIIECSAITGSSLYHFIIPAESFDSDYIIIERDKIDALKNYCIQYVISQQNSSETVDSSFPLPKIKISADGTEYLTYTEYVKTGSDESNSYEIKKPSVGNLDSSGRYYYRATNGREYQFVGWKVMVGGVETFIDPYRYDNPNIIKLSDYVSGNDINILFEAKWFVTNRQVQYVLSFPNESKINGTKPSLDTSIKDILEIKSRDQIEHFTTAGYSGVNPGTYNITVTYKDESGTNYEETITYEFAGWETERGELIKCAASDISLSTEINLDEEIGDGTDAGQKRYDADNDYVIKLKTRWKPDKMIVIYNLNITNGKDNISTIKPSIYPTAGTNAFVVSGQEIDSYYVRNVNPIFYKTNSSGSIQTGYEIYDFTGWKTESDAEIQPEASIALDTSNLQGVYIYDKNGDGIINLTGQWGNKYKNKNDVNWENRHVNFFVLLKAANDDIFNFNPELSTNSALFSPSVHKTLMRPFEAAPVTNGYEKGKENKEDGRRFYLANYNPDEISPEDITFDNIAEVNTAIRRLGSSGGYFYDGTYYYTVDFPTDEQVFNSIKNGMKEKNEAGNYKYEKYEGKEFDLNGTKVSRKLANLDLLDTLTTENYTIDWYICKLQNDGWHIDGKLMPKVSFVTVTKTFAGNTNALNNIPEDFHITVDNIKNEGENNDGIRPQLVETLNAILWKASKSNINNINVDIASVANEQLRNAVLIQFKNAFGAGSEEYKAAKTAIDDCNANENLYKLILDDRTDAESQSQYGIISGKASNGVYGYTQKQGDKYTWIVPSVKGSQFNINEHNYQIYYEKESPSNASGNNTNAADNSNASGDISSGTDNTGDESSSNRAAYGIIAQYSVTNTVNQEDTGMTQWFSQITGAAATYPRDIINLSSTQATNLFNTYVTTDVFTIQVRDIQNQGSSIDNPMPGVKFRVYEVLENGTRESRILEYKINGPEGEYSVPSSEVGGNSVNTGNTYVAETSASGNIMLTLPGKPDVYIYEVVEEIPEGYKGYDGNGSGFAFRIRVNKDGTYTVQDANGAAINRVINKNAGEYDYPNESTNESSCAMNLLVSGTPGGIGGELVMGAMIVNRPETFTATIKKEWGDDVQDSQKGPVTVAIKGHQEGVDNKYIINEKQELNTANEWKYVWEDTSEKAKELPLMIGNTRIIYEVEETKINGDEAGSSGFNTWEYTIDAKFWDNRDNGNELGKTGNQVSVDDALNVRKAEYVIKNDLLIDAARIYIRKGDYNSRLLLDADKVINTKFHIYKGVDQNSSGGFYKEYSNGSGTSSVYVQDKGSVTFPDGKNEIERRFEKGSVYYIEETGAPNGYQVYDGILQVSISENKQVSYNILKTESSDKKHIEVNTIGGTMGQVTFYDEPDCIAITKVLVGSGASSKDKFIVTIQNAALAYNAYTYSVDGSDEIKTISASGGSINLVINGATGEGLVTKLYGLPEGNYSIKEDPKGYTPEGVEINGATSQSGINGYHFDHTSSVQTNIKFTNRQDGIDVRFMKVNGFGEPLGGAEFKLYTSYESAKDAITNPDKGDNNVQAIIVNGEGGVKSVTSAKEADAPNSIAIGDVVFKAPKRVYYMAETAAPDGYKTEDVYILLVGEENLTVPDSDAAKADTLWEAGNVMGNISQEDIDKQTHQDTTETTDDVQYAIFQIDGKTGMAVETSDIATFGILNESIYSRKVILRKVAEGSYKSLEEAQFRIFRADLTEWTNGQPTDESGNPKGYYESGNNGVYFIDKLPYGKYYLVETEAPTGYGTNNGKIFILTVDGKEDSPKVDPTSAVATGTGDLLIANLKTQVLDGKVIASRTETTP